MFMPDNVYGNADVKLTGEAVPEDYIEKHKEDHDDLKKPENVIGWYKVSFGSDILCKLCRHIDNLVILHSFQQYSRLSLSQS